MKKAELPTGRKGFTLIETLLAVVIFSSGILFIAPALLRSGSILAHLDYGYEAGMIAENLIAKNEENLRKFHQINEAFLQGKVESLGIDYSYEIDFLPQDIFKHLYLLTVRVYWQDSKPNQLARSAYILQ